VQSNLHFLNVGPSQPPRPHRHETRRPRARFGRYQHIVVVSMPQPPKCRSEFRIGPDWDCICIRSKAFRGSDGRQSSFNTQTGTLGMPSLTTAVFCDGAGPRRLFQLDDKPWGSDIDFSSVGRTRKLSRRHRHLLLRSKGCDARPKNRDAAFCTSAGQSDISCT